MMLSPGQSSFAGIVAKAMHTHGNSESLAGYAAPPEAQGTQTDLQFKWQRAAANGVWA